VKQIKDIKNIKKILLVCVCVIIYVYYAAAMIDEKTIEQYDVSAGFGVDLYKDSTGNVKYSIPFSVLVFKGENRQYNIIKTGEASSGAETRQNRQLKTDKQLLLGSQKIMLFSESLVRYGLKYNADIQFNSTKINDRGIILVCEGKTEDMLSYKVKGYASSAEYIEGMVKTSMINDFFSKEYTALNMYVRLDTEGRNLVLPYIEISDKGLEVTGFALFKGDKMVNKVNVEEGKFMNIMREYDINGFLSIQKNSDEFMSFYGNTKRRVKCNKVKDGYEFDIIIDINGDVIANTLYKEFNGKTKKELEETLSKDVEKKCSEFINKMQNEYKLDCLELGMYAAAKYGRDTGVDWNQVVSNSIIKVKANVKVDKVGRGAY